MMFTKNQLTTLTIEDMTDTGEGIGHADGITVFVNHAIPGDFCRVRILKAKKTYAIGKVEELLSEAPSRIVPECPQAARCGGCQLSYMSYEEQLRLKQKKVQDCIRRIGGFSDAEVAPIIGMEDPKAYRNNGQFPVGAGTDGKPVLGFYAGRTHRIVPTDGCRMLWPGHEAILTAVRGWMEENRVAPYNEETGKGLVRHVLMRKGFATGEIAVCLVINGERIPAGDRLWKKLSEIPGMVGLSLNVNRAQTNVILGDRLIPLFGNPCITDRIGDVSFEISPMAFYQVNPVQTKVLYDTALTFAGLTGRETVWDLYCGIGTISLFLAKAAKQVFGLEIVPEAIENAKKNAAANAIANAEFYVGAAEDVFPKLVAEDTRYRADVIVVDPPRKGCDAKLLETMLAMAPERIVYVSCDPATLARDLRILCEGGYHIERIRPVDQFPGSVHVETVALLTRTGAI
ncbi:MAG: 23S rRNA (uracil(1939)-C(5))-methyltransferase RlmD [Lachnospiraceae bacterium]|nr:23S rRNA (uracil(1939)-C(5))-methyltransferase RlmD [Lachnospiraceae bacterium]